MNNLIIECQSCHKKNKIPADKQHLGPKCGSCGTQLILTGKAVPVELSDSEFHNFIQNVSLPVMVDFFSPTCGPCQSMMPVVNSLAQKYVNKCVIAKIDTTRNPQIATFFNIRGVPCFYFFKDAALVDQIVGAAGIQALEEKINNLLG